jgi:peptide deformylase
MAKLPIVQDGAHVLRETAHPVPPELFGSEELATILRDMADTLDAEPDGVALAAPQVAIPYRIFIVRYDRMTARGEETTEQTGPDIGIFINPDFVKTSRKRDEMQEGCLSVRGRYGSTYRHIQATVRAQDEHGNWFTRGGGGILAQAYQHEIDHLDGILFIDHAEDIREERRGEETHAVEPA